MDTNLLPETRLGVEYFDGAETLVAIEATDRVQQSVHHRHAYARTQRRHRLDRSPASDHRVEHFHRRQRIAIVGQSTHCVHDARDVVATARLRPENTPYIVSANRRTHRNVCSNGRRSGIK
jgi:hypothetical protein